MKKILGLMALIAAGTNANAMNKETFTKLEALAYISRYEGYTSIPFGFTKIADRAFMNDYDLKDIELPQSLISIGNDAFAGCVNLRRIDIQNPVESIGNRAFADCISLYNIHIPSSVQEIGSEAFSGCSNLIHVSIPSQLKNLGHNAFAGCTNLSFTVANEDMKNNLISFHNIKPHFIFIDQNPNPNIMNRYVINDKAIIGAGIDNGFTWEMHQDDESCSLELTDIREIGQFSLSQYDITRLVIKSFYKPTIKEYALDACLNLQVVEFFGVPGEIDVLAFGHNLGLDTSIIIHGERNDEVHQQLLKAGIREENIEWILE